MLLELDGRLGPDALAGRLRYWLSRGADAGNARLIAGLFSLHRGTLVRHQALVGAVTDFRLDLAQLTPLLPCRRAAWAPSARRSGPTSRRPWPRTWEWAPARGAGAPPGLQRRPAGRRPGGGAVLAGWEERYGLA